MLFLLPATAAISAPSRQNAPPDAESELVDIRTIDPTIVIELRYATSQNIAGRPLYPPNMQALIRPSVAKRLLDAHNYLRARGYGLKIWDAYRPKLAHAQLWQLSRNTSFVSDPNDGIGSLHTWGVAVDATLVDSKGREMTMPTDYDNFTPAAEFHYRGRDPAIRFHLHLLQSAMARAGFYGLRTEWWHFIAENWKSYRSVGETAPPPRQQTGKRPASSRRKGLAHGP